VLMAELIFLGTGPSSGIPSLKCRLAGSCKVCDTTTRTNVSIIINKGVSSILVDCGKHFYTQYNRYLSTYGNTIIPELLITHPHADAIGGIDTYLMMCTGKKNVYSSKFTLDFIRKTNEYYFVKPGDPEHRGYFHPNVLAHGQITQIGGIKVHAFEVDHGGIKSLAFLIDDKVLYISDTSDLHPIPEEFYHRDVLIIDCLTIDQHVRGHLNLQDVKRYASILQPGRVILTGLSHRIEQVDFLDGFRVAYDGMRFEFN
ncbi:putative Metallo-hydrolase/oxidoreductase, Beta-lactamase-like protein, partial [Trachipleistophora hominis]